MMHPTHLLLQPGLQYTFRVVGSTYSPFPLFDHPSSNAGIHFPFSYQVNVHVRVVSFW